MTNPMRRVPCTYCFTLIRFFIIYLFSEVKATLARAPSCLWPRILNICNRYGRRLRVVDSFSLLPPLFLSSFFCQTHSIFVPFRNSVEPFVLILLSFYKHFIYPQLWSNSSERLRKFRFLGREWFWKRRMDAEW